jgi:hypothetical protein
VSPRQGRLRRGVGAVAAGGISVVPPHDPGGAAGDVGASRRGAGAPPRPRPGGPALARGRLARERGRPPEAPHRRQEAAGGDGQAVALLPLNARPPPGPRGRAIQRRRALRHRPANQGTRDFLLFPPKSAPVGCVASRKSRKK